MHRSAALLLAAALLGGGLATMPATAATQPRHVPALSYDVNGDGHRDLIVSAPDYNRGYRGRIGVALGSSSGFVPGPELHRRTAILVSADFNRDGYADVVSAPYDNSVTIDYGDPQQFGTTTQAEQLDGNATSLAVGDFNSDGFPDLAIGGTDASPVDVPGAPTVTGAPAVIVRYGSADGLDNSQQPAPGHFEEWTEDSATGDGSTGGDNFGRALAAGDVNGDGIDDLVVGIPGMTVGDYDRAGAVTELFGTSSGLSADGNAVFSLATPGVKGEPAHQKDCDEDDGCNSEGENFGSSIAVGDIDGDGYGDVAIGTPDKVVVPGAHDADGNPGHDGSLSVLYGASTGMTSRSQFITYNTSGVPGSVPAHGARFARFTSQLTVGDFNHDGHADVAAFAPLSKADGGCGCTAVLVFRGGQAGLHIRHVHQLTGPGLQHYGDVVNLGEPMLAVDLNNNGFGDLVVGAIYTSSPGAYPRGAVAVFRGGDTGLVESRGRLLTQRRTFGSAGTRDDQFGYVGTQEMFITGD